MFEIRYKSHHDVEGVISKFIKDKMTSKKDFFKILNAPNKTKQLGIYLHTPYCDKICSFCNMNRKKLDNDLENYTNYLCKEIKKYGEFEFSKTSEIDVVFFGGGTPTIYKAEQLERILKTLREGYKFKEDYEMTFETTLHNLNNEKIEIFEKYGVNRISVGIQTFSDKGRKFFNRTYDKTYVIKRLKEIRKRFTGLICIDIIYNFPNQTDEEILEDVKIISELNIDSASFYSLMIQGNSKISKDLEKDKNTFIYTLSRDEEIHNIFLEESLKRGYKLLELTKITNGKDKYRYITNNNALKNLLPIGTGAGGRIQNIGCYHLNKLMTFYAKRKDLHTDVSILSGMMQFEKFTLDNLKKYCPEKSYPAVFDKIREFEKEGYLEIKEDIVSYTFKGIFWGNTLIAEVVKEIFKNL